MSVADISVIIVSAIFLSMIAYVGYTLCADPA